MEIDIQNEVHAKIIRITGHLNAVTSTEAENKLSQLVMGGNKNLLIDLNGLDYISSAGLRIFLATNKQVKKMNGEIRFIGLNNTVKEVFEIAGFTMIFKVFEDTASALLDWKV